MEREEFVKKVEKLGCGFLLKESELRIFSSNCSFEIDTILSLYLIFMLLRASIRVFI